MKEMTNALKLWPENMKGKDQPLLIPKLDEGIILKWILYK
jgi:hypothetical protein